MNPSLPPLNLPSFAPQVKPPAFAGDIARIYDPLRGKWVALTPEEWVRQHFVNMLMTELGYKKGLMANEISIHLNDTLRRCDTVVYDAAMTPVMIVEYKAPSVRITQRVFDQIARYNMVLGARWLAVSNGLSHYCCRLGIDNGQGYAFVRALPLFNEL